MSNPKIRILPEFISNQIAAGEVVQQPESVVKELVENSIDAGADTVLVRVKDAGKQLIQVVDNGHGMSREDIALSLKRHATSKIITADDLEAIKSFGFRGEALASIASVSTLEIRSRRHDDAHGYKLLSEPMRDIIIEPVQMDHGTQVYVKNLFFNVPVRRKFMKSNLTEFRYISDTMIRFGLSKPNVRLTFYDDERLIFDLKKNNMDERIKILLGEDAATSIMTVDYRQGDITIKGFIGKPHLAKRTRSNQYLFLNDRTIFNKSINYAVFSAFEHLLDKSAHPLFVLNIIVEPTKFDVNIHPQKHEVKFDDERAVYSAVNHAVKNTLRNNNLAPEFKHNDFSTITQYPSHQFTSTSTGNKAIVNKHTGEIIESSKNSFNNFQFEKYNRETLTDKDNHDISSAFDEIFGKKQPTQPIESQSAITEFRADNLPATMFWQLHRKYIFMQTEDGCTIIDQHAAHERILYEKALAAMTKHFANTQELLFPIDITLSPTDMTTVLELKSELIDLGYNYEIIEPNKIIIKGVPVDVAGQNESRTFREILETYSEYKKIRNTNKRDNLAASFACKSAIKTGCVLSNQEMLQLYNDLMSCNVPYACPHGRPVIINLNLKEFDKKFGRIL